MTETNDRPDAPVIQSEGETRTARILKIIQGATTAIVTELKAGADEIRLTDSQTTANQTASSEAAKSSAWMTALTQTQFAKRIKSFLLQLDTKLTNQYGDAYQTRLRDQYATAQQRLEQFRTWYAKSRANAATIQISPLEQKQAAIGLKFADQAVSVAHKEQQIRQQIKQRLNSAIQAVRKSDNAQ